jgi:hypothetical protein
METDFKFVYHQDSGHGWLEVSKLFFKQYNLDGLFDFIPTNHSYQNSQNFFLEEDCDMSAFLRLIKNQGYSYELKAEYQDGQSFIREYPCYKNQGREASYKVIFETMPE